MNQTDFVIIGGGMAGLSAAYFLRDRGSVVLLEADRCGTSKGSSFGQTRMYREMYSDRFLCERAKEANALWSDMESAHGTELRRQHGLLFYGEAFDEETIEGSIPGAARVMDELNIPYESLSSADIRARWPIQAKPDHVGLFEPTAGAILSDRALELMRSVAVSAGVQVVESASVERIEPTGTELRILSSGVEWRTRRAVVAAGGWTSRLLAPFSLGLPTRLWSMLWAHYEVDPSLDFPQWFCFQRPQPDINDGGLYYGFPQMSSIEGRPVIKVGIDWAPDEMQVADMADFPEQPLPHLTALLDDFMRSGLRGVGPRLETWCSPYTMSPDANFIVDRVPGEPRISFFTGGSGQAFKFAPLIGQYLADLADGTRTATPNPWALRRFAAAA
ncbi:MAG: FAD-dependent oxidoreductase [Myxococcota bacterium]